MCSNGGRLSSHEGKGKGKAKGKLAWKKLKAKAKAAKVLVLDSGSIACDCLVLREPVAGFSALEPSSLESTHSWGGNGTPYSARSTPVSDTHRVTHTDTVTVLSELFKRSKSHRIAQRTCMFWPSSRTSIRAANP